MICPRCQYEWENKSKMMYVCCPNCRKQFKREVDIDGSMEET